MNKYTLLFAFIAIFLIGIVSGVLTYPNQFTKEMLSLVGLDRVVRAQTEANFNHRFALDRRPTSELFGFLVLLRTKDQHDEAMSVAGELLNRNIPVLERLQSRGDRIQRMHARQVLSRIASEFLPTGQDTQKNNAAKFIDRESLKILSLYANESAEKNE